MNNSINFIKTIYLKFTNTDVQIFLIKNANKLIRLLTRQLKLN